MNCLRERLSKVEMQRHHSSATFSSVGILLDCLGLFYKGISLDPLLVCTYFAANASRSITNVHDFTPSRKSAKINETSAATGKVPPACMFSKGHFNYRLGCFIRHPHHTMGKPLRRVYPNPRMKFPSSLPCMGPSTLAQRVDNWSSLEHRSSGTGSY